MSFESTTLRLPNGEIAEMFSVKHLADSLGRTTKTVRKWEISGVIPPCFRDSKGRRVYTQEQIDVIVKCAERAKITQGVSLNRTSFSTWVYAELKELNKKYFKKGDTK